MNKKRGFVSLIALGIVVGILIVGSVYGWTHPSQPLTAGSTYNPTGGQTYRLQSSISSTATTLTLTSFKEPVSNIKYTMTYLNSSIEYATIDPQNNTSKEFVSFTGITQNSDNTATLTGVTRGLGFSYPYTASTTLAQAHSGQSIFILSNPPQLTNQYLNKTNDGETVTGLVTYTTPPILSTAATSSLQAASIGYVTGVVLGSTPVIVGAGGTGLTSLPQDMILIGNGASNVTSTSTPTVRAIYATSTTALNLFAGNVAVTGNTTLTGQLVASSSNNVIASSTQYIQNVGFVNATSSIKLNGSAVGDYVTSVQFNGSGTTQTSTTSLKTYAVPANTLNITSKAFRITYDGTTTGGSSGSCYFVVNYGTGAATSTVGYAKSGLSTVGHLNMDLFATSTTAQSATGYGTYAAANPLQFTFFSAANITNISYLDFAGYTDGDRTCTLVRETVELITS